MDHKSLLGRLNEYDSTEAHLTLRMLLAADLIELREKMDTAEDAEVQKLQGAIRYVKKLQKELDPEGRKKPTIYDGAFGD